MVSLPVAFVAGHRPRHRPGPAPVEHHQPVVGVGHGRAGPLRACCSWPCWSGPRRCRRARAPPSARRGRRGRSGFRHTGDSLRKRVGTTGVLVTVVVAALLPLVLDVGRSFLMSQICIYGVIALSLTVLTGWAGQVSLGQFGLVAVGADMAAHLGGSVPAHPAAPLRRRGDRPRVDARRAHRPAHPRPVPGREHARLRPVHADLGAGHVVLDRAAHAQDHLLGPARPPVHADLATHVVRAGPDVGARLRLVLARRAHPVGPHGAAVARPRHRPAPDLGTRQRGGGRARPASRWCAPSSWPSPCRGSWPATPGCAWPSPPSGSAPTPSTPSISILVVSMVVIGGLDAIPGAVLGALYLVGLPAIFGSSTTIQFLTSGVRAHGLHPLPARRHGPGHAPARRPRHRRRGEPARPAQRRAAGPEPPPRSFPTPTPEGAVAEVGA